MQILWCLNAHTIKISCIYHWMWYRNKLGMISVKATWTIILLKTLAFLKISYEIKVLKLRLLCSVHQYNNLGIRLDNVNESIIIKLYAYKKLRLKCFCTINYTVCILCYKQTINTFFLKILTNIYKITYICKYLNIRDCFLWCCQIYGIPWFPPGFTEIVHITGFVHGQVSLFQMFFINLICAGWCTIWLLSGQ